MLYAVTIDDRNYRLDINRADGRWSCLLDGRELEVDAVLICPNMLSLRIGNIAHEVKSERVGGDFYLWMGSTRFAAEVRDPRSLSRRSLARDAQGSKKITASMPGKIVRLLVREGENVELGTGLAVVEAMKMQNEIKSPKKGVVQKVLMTEGAAVNAGDVLLIVD